MIEIDNKQVLEQQIKAGVLEGCVFQNLDLTPYETEIIKLSVKESVFLGCNLNDALRKHLDSHTSVIFPILNNLKFNPYRGELYNRDDLYRGFDPGRKGSYEDTPDYEIYKYWLPFKEAETPIFDSLVQRLHDQAIDDAINDFRGLHKIVHYKIVAIMGGHKLSRETAAYRDVALLSRLLCREGYLVVTGGGPGAMEAGHLGALFSKGAVDELDAAIQILASVPGFGEGPEGIHAWLSTAYKVLSMAEKIEPTISLSIPTWVYGHEPSTPFASHIAKYFANSIREDGLVSIARGGIIFAPGSAGTVQEIFQDLAQNHYGSLGEASAMVLMGQKYWTETIPVKAVLDRVPIDEKTKEPKPYAQLISCIDKPEDIVEFIKTHPPLVKPKTPAH